MQSVRAYCLLVPPVPRLLLRFLSRRAEEPAHWRRPRGPPPRGAASASAARSVRLPAGSAAAGPGAPPHEAALPPGAGAGAARPASPSQIRSSRCRFTLCRSMSRAGSRRSAPRRNGGGTRRCSPPAPAAKRKGRAAAPRPRSRGGLAAAAPLASASASGCRRRGPAPRRGRPTTPRGAAASEGPRPAARQRAAGPSAPPAPPRPGPPRPAGLSARAPRGRLARWRVGVTEPARGVLRAGSSSVLDRGSRAVPARKRPKGGRCA